ncbi:MAG: cytidine deaminase [Candidatus Asgardarchaeia archaeon]
MKKINFNELEPIFKELLTRAKDAMVHSYSPYSHFKVGAAIVTSSGKIYTGTNIENASYGLTICAERVAIFKAVSEGEREISAIAIISDSKDVISPCGSCRQVISEFSRSPPNDTIVIMSNYNMEKIIVTKISELLPMSFSSKYLKK